MNSSKSAVLSAFSLFQDRTSYLLNLSTRILCRAMVVSMMSIYLNQVAPFEIGDFQQWSNPPYLLERS
jgi:hypothetical protein